MTTQNNAVTFKVGSKTNLECDADPLDLIEFPRMQTH